MVAGEVDTWARYERGKAGDEVLRAEQDVCGAVAERVLELVNQIMLAGCWESETLLVPEDHFIDPWGGDFQTGLTAMMGPGKDSSKQKHKVLEK